MANLTLSTEKQTLESVIENITDDYGIAEDHNIYDISVEKGHKYSFEVQSDSIYRDQDGIDVHNKVDLRLRDSNGDILDATNGLIIDKTLAGNVLVTFVAQETATYTIDIYGSAGFSNTTEYGDSSRIESPFTLKSQDLGNIDNYSDLKSDPFNIDLTSLDAVGLQSVTISDTSIYDSRTDSDWFSIDVTAGTDYKVTVTTTDGIYKRIDMQSPTAVAWHKSDKLVVAGENDNLTEQYYYLAAEDTTMLFEVTGGKGAYELTIEEAIIDDEENTGAAAKVLAIDTVHNGNLYSQYDYDFFKLDGLTTGDTYKVTIMTDELNTIMNNDAYYIRDHTNSNGMDDPNASLYDSASLWAFTEDSYEYSIDGGKEFYFIAEDADHFLRMTTFSGDLKGDYTIKYENVNDIETDLVTDVTPENNQTLAIDTPMSFITSNHDDYITVNLDTAGLYTFSYSKNGNINLTNKNDFIANDYTGYGLVDGNWVIDYDTSTYTAGTISTSAHSNFGIDGENKPATVNGSADGNFGDFNYSHKYALDENGEWIKKLTIEITDEYTGEYYIHSDVISSMGETEINKIDLSYTYLALDDIDDGGNSQDTATSIELGTSYTAQVDHNDSTRKTIEATYGDGEDISTDYDWFKIDLKAGETYKFEYNSDAIYDMDLHLEHNISIGGVNSVETIYNNNQKSAGLTAVFQAVYKAAGDNMQKSMDFLDSYDIVKFKSLMDKFENNFTSTTSKDKEDFVLYAALLKEMKEQFNNNDIDILMRDENNNGFGMGEYNNGGYVDYYTLELDDLNVNLTTETMNLTDTALNLSYNETIESLMTYASTLKEQVVKANSITQADIDTNQQPISTEIVNQFSEADFTPLKTKKIAVETIIDARTPIDITTNANLIDGNDTADRDLFIAELNSLSTLDYVSNDYSLNDLIDINKNINELTSALEQYSNISNTGKVSTFDWDLFMTSNVITNVTLTDTNDVVLTATLATEYMVNNEPNQYDIPYPSGFTTDENFLTTGEVTLTISYEDADGNAQTDIVKTEYLLGSVGQDARDNTEIVAKLEAEISSIFTLSETTQIQKALKLGELEKIKTDIESINETYFDWFDYNSSGFYDSLMTDTIIDLEIFTSEQQTSFDTLKTGIDVDALKLELDTFNSSDYDNATASTLIDEIQNMNSIYTSLTAMTLTQVEKNLIDVAVQDRKVKLINLFTDTIISDELDVIKTIMDGETNISSLVMDNSYDDNLYDYYSGFQSTGNYISSSQTYDDAKQDMLTLIEVLNRVDNNAVIAYKDTYISDLYTGINSDDFLALIEADYGANWYAYGNQGEVFTVLEDDTYYLKFNKEYSTKLSIGEYEFIVNSMNTDDAGDTIETSYDFKSTDFKDFSTTDETESTHLNDNKVQAFFSGDADKDMYSYEFEANAQYKINLDYPGGVVKIYDADGDRIMYDKYAFTQDMDAVLKYDRTDEIYTFKPEVAGTYYIEASKANYSWAKQNDYTLTIEDMNKKDSVGSTVSSAVSYGETVSDDEIKSEIFKLDFEKDRDWFKIDTTAGTNYTIDVTSTNMKFTDIKVFDENGLEVWDNNTIKTVHHFDVTDSAGDYNFISTNWDSTANASINLYAGNGQTPAGEQYGADGTTYYVQVSNNSEVGDYNLDISVDTTADDYGSSVETTANFRDIDSSDTIANDGIINGSFERHNDKDWFNYNWEKAVYEVVIDAANAENISLNFFYDSWINGLSNVTNDYTINKNFVLDRADTDGSSKHYTIISDSQYNFNDIFELKNISGAGDYTLSINKIADIDETAIAITLDENSSYTKTDDEIVYQTDKSFYNMDVEDAKTYQIELNADQTNKDALGQLLIEVKDSNGNTVDLLKEWNPDDVMNRATFVSASNDKYTIEVKTAKSENTGTFSFNIKEIDMSGDIGSSVSNHGDFNTLAENNTVTSDLNPSIDKDWFKYNFEAGVQYLISVDTANSDTGLVYLYDSEGDLYKANQMWDTNDKLATSDKSILFNPSESGEFYLSVADAVSGTYTLNVEEYTDNSDILESIETTTSVVVDSNDIVTSLIDNKDDKDWIKVTLDAGNIYRIEAVASGDKTPVPLDIAINGIFNSSGELIQDSASVNGLQYIKAESSGVHYIEVSGKNDTLGFYDISVTSNAQTDAVLADINSTAEVSTQNKYTGKIDYFYDKDWIKVTLEAGKQYDISMKGNSLKDTHITGIFTSTGDTVADSSNNDAGDFTLDSKVTLIADGDVGDADVVYFIEASGYGDEQGTYTVEVTENTNEIEENLSETVGSDKNNLTSNAITGLMGRYKYGEINHGTDSDLFAYEFEAGVTYDINMLGSDSGMGTLTNSYIASIRDSSGSEIAGYSNAHGGKGNDSFLSFTADTSGTYYVEAASQYYTQGSFKLNVSEQNDGLGTVKAFGDGSHTMMVYLGGDNNLERYMLENLIQMQLSTVPENWNITFLIDRAEGYDARFGDWTETRQGIIEFVDLETVDIDTASTNILSPMESLGELNTGDGDTLTNFINWSSKMAAADSYSLVISNHGGGVTGSVWDDTDNHDNLIISELTASIEATQISQTAVAAGDKAFEMIGFDTCLQGVIDQQYALTSVTDVVLASEEVSWSNFWDYTDWFENIALVYEQNNDTITGAQMATALVDTIPFNAKSSQDQTYSAVYTDLLDEVVDAVATLNSELSNISAQDKQRVEDGSKSVVIFTDENQMDLGAFANMIDGLDISSSVDTAAQDVYEAVVDAVISNHTNMTGNGGDATGIAINYNGGVASDDYMDNFELAGIMNMEYFFEVV